MQYLQNIHSNQRQLWCLRKIVRINNLNNINNDNNLSQIFHITYGRIYRYLYLSTYAKSNFNFHLQHS